MKKKIITLLLALSCLAAALPLALNASEDSPEEHVEVTVSIINGSPVLAAERIRVIDADVDGVYTINDALCCAHEYMYSGGAKAGFASEPSQYGLSLTKLWGDTSGAYGYYLNDRSPDSLLDTVTDGDHVTAFVYQDTLGWSDAYSYFDKQTVTVREGDTVTLNLSYLALDPETWATTVTPAEGATLTVDGNDTDNTVNMDGMVSVVFDAAGTYLVSAHSDLNIVPPVCVVTVEKAPAVNTPPVDTAVDDDPQSYGWVVAICAAVICSATAVAVAVSKKNGSKK